MSSTLLRVQRELVGFFICPMSHFRSAQFAQYLGQRLDIVDLEPVTCLEDNGLEIHKMSENVTGCCQASSQDLRGIAVVHTQQTMMDARCGQMLRVALACVELDLK